MWRTIVSLIASMILIALTACAGKNFVVPTSDAFRLGQTTYSQVVQQLGDPAKTGSLTKNGTQMKSITYVYATQFEDPLESGVIPARALMYYFHNDVLVCQSFVSSFKSDNTNFDDYKVERIAKGKTTRADVIQLLGKPSLQAIPPMVKETSGEAIGYSYGTTRGSPFTGLRTFRKALTVSFDSSSVVSDVEYTTSGN